MIEPRRLPHRTAAGRGDKGGDVVVGAAGAPGDLGGRVGNRGGRTPSSKVTTNTARALSTLGRPDAREDIAGHRVIIARQLVAVATGFKEEQTAGTHSVIFNADGLPSGIYFYKITAGNFTQMRKMVSFKVVINVHKMSDLNELKYKVQSAYNNWKRTNTWSPSGLNPRGSRSSVLHLFQKQKPYILLQI